MGPAHEGETTNAKQDPHEVLDAWYLRKKQEPNTDLKELEKSYVWCHKPDRKRPNMDKAQAAAMDYNTFLPEQLWKGFLKNKHSDGC